MKKLFSNKLNFIFECYIFFQMYSEDMVDEDHPVDHRLRSLFENDQIQNFLQRHGLATYGRTPLRREELEERLQQIDDQSSVDLIAQSLVETALDIKRPLRRSNKHSTLTDSNYSADHNLSVTIYDNSCAITMVYCGPTIIRNDTLYTFKIQSDEVIVMQYQTNVSSIMVYKSFLKPNDEFTFKSHRLPDTPFTIAIYVNGVIDNRISTCCEQGYLKQRSLRSKRSAFQLLSVDGGPPCYTCQVNDLMNTSLSDNEEAQSELISINNLDQVTPSISLPTMSALSESTAQTHSTKKEKIKPKPKTMPSNFVSTDTDLPSEVVQKQLTTTEPLISKPEKIQPSTTVEKMIDNDETDKDLKNDEKVVNLNPIKQTDGPAPKQNQNESIQMKIPNVEEGEEQGLISSVAKHEMQQLLSTYLVLLLQPSKSQTNDTNPTTIPASEESSSTIQQLVISHPMRSQKQIEYQTDSFEPSQLDNVETFILIWLDATIDKNEDTAAAHIKLRAIVNSLFTFHTIDETIDFIQNLYDEKVFLIISGSLGWLLFERSEMSGLSQLDSIYIYCHDESKHKALIDRDHKVRGIFTNIDPLCDRLQEDMKQTFNDRLPISVAPGASSQDQLTTDEQKQKKQVAFLRAQLHRELLFTMEYPADARLDLVEFCQSIYSDNATEQAYIKELKDSYHSGSAVWWYTRATFLHKMLNTALFRQNIRMLYRFHFFIKDLHMQLEQLHSLYKLSLESRTFTVYRGLGMSMKAFDETFREQVNNLLAFDTFLSTSLNKEVALEFARNKSNSDDESVLLEFEIDADKLQRPFADVSRLSEFGLEDEILFSIGTVFRIDRVAQEKTSDGIWLVHLVSIEEEDEQLKKELKQTQLTLLNFFRRVCQAQIKRGNLQQIATSYTNIASIYFKQNEREKSLELYQIALKNLLESPSPDPLTVAKYRSNIAMVHMALKQQDQALELYEQVLDSRMKDWKPNDPLLIETFHAIGDIYCANKQFDKALEQYQQALDKQPISLSPPFKHNPSLIAATHMNIAVLYHNQHKTDQALDHFSKALQYQRQHLSEYHPMLTYSYNNIGAMYYRLKKFDLALQNHLLTLKIEERSLPCDHKTLAVTYTNIATTYEQLNNYDQAIEYAHKAVNQLKLHLPDDHADVQIKQAYLDRLLMDKDIFQNK